MSEQFRRIRKPKTAKVKKESRSKTFRLAEEIREAKSEAKRDESVLRFIHAIQQAVITFSADPEAAGDPRLDAVRRRLKADPSYVPPIELCAGLVTAATFYAEIYKLDSGSLRDRLIAIEGDDLPDSLADPGEL